MANFGKNIVTLYYQSMRQGRLFCGKSTFNKYANLLGWKKQKRFKPKKNKSTPADSIFEWLHVDVSKVPTLNDGMQYWAVVKDNKSKAILHQKSFDKPIGSGIIKELFVDTFQKYELYNRKQVINILSDGGPENKGEFTTWIGDLECPSTVNKLTAKTTEHPQPNNMIEAVFRIYKTEFLQGKVLPSREAHLKSINEFENFYNYHRFPTELYGLAPMEVIDGALVDQKRFQKQIEQAQLNRKKTNREFKQCVSLIGCGT